MKRLKNVWNKLKNAKLPWHVYVSYLLLVTLAFTGVTFSKYVATASGADTARVATFGNLTLSEENKPANDKKFIIIPGVDITKDPKVTFGPGETAAYVFVSVETKKWEFDQETQTYQINVKHTGEDPEQFVGLTWSVDPAWTFLETTSGRQVYYKTVEAGGTLENVPVIKDSKITVSENIYASDLDGDSFKDEALDITFQAYAVQATGFSTAADAWKSISKSK